MAGWHPGDVDDRLEDSRYEIAGKLRSPCPHVHRFEAVERETGKRVELRVSRQQSEEHWLLPFSREVRDLSTFDHPGFLPLLDRGVIGQRGFYTVPLREDPHLGQVAEDAAFDVGKCFGVITFLASALCHAHEKGVFLGFIHPPLVALGRQQGLPYFIHHHISPDGLLDLVADRIPEDCEVGVDPSARANLFLWGRLGYFLLSKGKYPYSTEHSEKRLPVRKLEPSIPGEIAEAIDASLEWSPDARPEDAKELYDAIREVGFAQPLALDDLPEAENFGAELPSAFSIDISGIQRGPVPDPGALNLAAKASVPDPAGPPPPGAAGPGLGKIFGSLFVVLAAFAGGLAFQGDPPPPPPPPAPAPRKPKPKKALKPRPKIEVEDADAAKLLRNPRVRGFLGGRETNEENFQKRFRNLLRLAARSQVPGDVADTERIAQLHELYKEDPRKAFDELDFYRRSLGRAVNYEAWKKAQEAKGKKP